MAEAVDRLTTTTTAIRFGKLPLPEAAVAGNRRNGRGRRYTAKTDSHTQQQATAIIIRSPPIVLVWKAAVASRGEPCKPSLHDKNRLTTTTTTAIIIRAPPIVTVRKAAVVGNRRNGRGEPCKRLYNNKERDAATMTKTDSSNNKTRAPPIVLIWTAVVAGNRRNVREN